MVEYAHFSSKQSLYKLNLIQKQSLTYFRFAYLNIYLHKCKTAGQLFFVMKSNSLNIIVAGLLLFKLFAH